ncbi:MAG: response regulator [Planctomycetes bacterium]|nr:response regulator [Planctomycetota bacterium]
MKILLVDDSATMRKIQRNVLSQMGYEDVVEAENGEHAIHQMKVVDFAIDLILCDWNMPKMNGIEFVRKIRSVENLKKIPIIMVTTEGERSKVIEAVQAGAKGYVVKPFTPDILRAKIEEIMGL